MVAAEPRQPGQLGLAAQVHVAAEEQRRRPATPRAARAARRGAPTPRGASTRAGSRPTTRRAAARRAPSAAPAARSAARCGARAIVAAHEDRVARRRRWTSAGPGCATEIARRSESPKLRDVSTCRSLRAARRGQQRRPPRRHLLQQRDVPFPARERGRELVEQRPAGRVRAPTVVEVPGQCPHPHTSSPAPSWTRTGSICCCTAPPRSRRRRSPRGRSRAARSRSCSTSRRRARARRSSPASSSSAGTRWSCAPDEMQLTRGESVRDTALHPLPPRRGDRPAHRRRGRAQRARRACDCSGREHALARCTTRARRSPTCRRCARRSARSTAASLTYVGDGNNVARSLAVVGALAGVEVRVAAPAGYQLPEGETPAVLFEDPAEAVAGADAVYTDVWVSMSDSEDSAAARREALAPYAIDDALLDQAGAGRLRAALPARPSGRGDHRVRALRRSASGSGTRPRTAATRRRRCSSCSFRPRAGRVGASGHAAGQEGVRGQRVTQRPEPARRDGDHARAAAGHARRRRPPRPHDPRRRHRPAGRDPPPRDLRPDGPRDARGQAGDRRDGRVPDRRLRRADRGADRLPARRARDRRPAPRARLRAPQREPQDGPRGGRREAATSSARRPARGARRARRGPRR